MSQMVKMFAPAMRKTGFFSEWARYIEAESSPEMLANLVLEHMRDASNDEIRRAASAFAAFIKTRSWTDVLSDLKDEIPANEFESLEKPIAKGFYADLRHLILMQVEDYWKDFVASKESEDAKPQITPSLSLAVVELVERQISIKMEALLPNIIEELKKHFRKQAGEDWKGESE